MLPLRTAGPWTRWLASRSSLVAQPCSSLRIAKAGGVRWIASSPPGSVLHPSALPKRPYIASTPGPLPPSESLPSILDRVAPTYQVLAQFRILALESSADDTCAAVIDSDRNILANVVRKQHSTHAPFGGIQPFLAQVCHAREMPGVIQQALREANSTLADIDGFAFTQGPGMYACLEKACTAAGSLAAATGKPLFGINHMQAHALTPLMTEEIPPAFPYLTFLISGGHSQILLSSSFDDHQILVDTGPVPAGIAFDRAGRALRLPYNITHGLGHALELLAATPSTSIALAIPPLPKGPFRLPIHKTSNFSFGAVQPQISEALAAFAPSKQADARQDDHEENSLTVEQKIAVARGFQVWMADSMIERLGLAIRGLKKKAKRNRDEWTGLSSLAVSGGVASNLYLRTRLAEFTDEHDMRLIFPPLALCTDNAAMIGNVAVDRFREGRNQPLWDVLPRKKWSIERLFAERDALGNEIESEEAGEPESAKT